MADADRHSSVYSPPGPRRCWTGAIAGANLKLADSHSVMNPFLSYLVGSVVAASAWTILVLGIERRQRRFAGLIGAWAATGVLSALWQAEAVPWLWVLLQGVLLLWLGAIALLIAAAVSIWSIREPRRLPLLCCVVMSIFVNIAAGLQFLWLATVSPGGV